MKQREALEKNVDANVDELEQEMNVSMRFPFSSWILFSGTIILRMLLRIWLATPRWWCCVSYPRMDIGLLVWLTDVTFLYGHSVSYFILRRIHNCWIVCLFSWMFVVVVHTSRCSHIGKESSQRSLRRISLCLLPASFVLGLFHPCCCKGGCGQLPRSFYNDFSLGGPEFILIGTNLMMKRLLYRATWLCDRCIYIAQTFHSGQLHGYLFVHNLDFWCWYVSNFILFRPSGSISPLCLLASSSFGVSVSCLRCTNPMGVVDTLVIRLLDFSVFHLWVGYCKQPWSYFPLSYTMLVSRLDKFNLLFEAILS